MGGRETVKVGKIESDVDDKKRVSRKRRGWSCAVAALPRLYLEAGTWESNLCVRMEHKRRTESNCKGVQGKGGNEKNRGGSLVSGPGWRIGVSH